MHTIERLTPEQQIAIQAEKLLLLSRAVVAPAAERHAAIARLQSTPHHLNLTQIYSQIGPMSTLCRLEENQAILLQLSTAVQKLAQVPVASAPMIQAPMAVDAEAAAFRKSWLFRLWRFLYGAKA
jgi:hypothetical protein